MTEYTAAGSGTAWTPAPWMVRTAIVLVSSFGIGTAWAWATEPVARAALAEALSMMGSTRRVGL